MPRGKKDLAAQVQNIVAEALDRVQALVRSSLSEELSDLIGGRGNGRKAKRLVDGPKNGHAAAGKKRGPGRPPSDGQNTTDLVEKLARLVGSKGPLKPKEARKVLGLTAPRMQAVAREAANEGRIKVLGAGPATRYARK